jgi:2-polyprenyl-3-methyl-5-hydroxy-6-metoxy-1,4-benzoquinol methylase
VTTASSDELLQHQQTLYESKNPTRRWLHCSRRDLILDWIDNKVPGGGDALEIGPGSGVYLPALAHRFRTVLALDCEQAYLQHAETLQGQFPNITPRVDDITKSSAPSACVDFILCSEVVEHIPRSDLAIKEMRRLLRSGGLLLLSTPQKWSTLETTARIALSPALIGLTKAIYREPVLEMGHINLMTATTIQRQLTSAGFEIIERHKSGLYMPLLAELGGASAAHFLKTAGHKIQDSSLSWLLWTQFYLARAV